MAAARIRLARGHECEAISDLALRSKAHWGYSAEFLEACRAELTFGASTCASGRMSVAVDGSAEAGGRVLGFSLIGGVPPSGELVALFVDPVSIGSGVGRLLLLDALDDAHRRGFRSLTLDADPGAESFYLRFGAVRVGTAISGSIPGRMLPRLEFTLPAPRPPSTLPRSTPDVS